MEDRALVGLDAEIAEMEKALNGTQDEPTIEEPTIENTVNRVEPVVQPTITPDPKLQADLNIAHKRFNNYKSSTDVTIRDLRNELSSLRSQVDNLHSENATLKVSKEPTKDVSSYFSTEDREILGETTVEALDRSVKEIVDSKVNPLQEQLNRERASKADAMKRERERINQDAQNIFVTRLRNAVPDYEQVLGDDNFRLRWIKDIDPLSGYSREQLFTRAEAEGDVGRVASFFNEYKALTTSKISALEEHVVPTGVTGNAPVFEEKGEFEISERFIDRFYDDLARGDIKYKGKKGRELAERTEAAIDGWVSNQFR